MFILKNGREENNKNLFNQKRLLGAFFVIWYNFIMKKIKLNFNSNLLANGSIFVILGVTPLFFNYFFPISIDLSKLVLFKIFSFILLFSVAWNLLKNDFKFASDVFKRFFPLGCLLFFLIISLPFSIDTANSWFGSYTRQEGLSSWLFYILWSILLILHLNVNKDKTLSLVNIFFKVASYSGLIVSIYALCQVLGLDFVSWSEPAKITGRAFSFLGQPNYLACWLVLIIPLSAYLVVTSLKNSQKFFWCLVFALQFLALLTTGSRAVFFVFLFVSTVWLFWFLFKEKKIAFKKIGIILITVLFLGSLFVSFLFFTNQHRFSEMTNLSQGSLAIRFNLWQTGWKSFLQKPFLGYGLENQKEVYVSHYKVDFALYSRPNTYSDRAHNLIIDTLLTSGILGLLVFVYFLYGVFSNLIKGLKKQKYSHVSIFLLWSLTAYLLSLLFNFSVTVTNIYFWFIVAMSFVVSDQTLIDVKNKKNNFDLIRLVIVLGLFLVFIYGAFRELKKIEADYYYEQTLTAITEGDYFVALVFKDYLDRTSPSVTFLNYYNQNISLRFLESLPQINNKITVMAIKQYLFKSDKQLAADNFENQFVKAFIWSFTDRRYESEKLFWKLSLISPELPKIYLAWGDSLMFNQDYKNAKIKFEKTLSLLPSSENPYLFGDQKRYLNIYYKHLENRLQQIELLIK